jgi:hypothetical protein
MDVTKPYEFIGFGAMDVTKAYEFMRLEPKGSRSGFWGEWFFGGLGCQGREAAHAQQNYGFLALPTKAARPKNRCS